MGFLWTLCSSPDKLGTQASPPRYIRSRVEDSKSLCNEVHLSRNTNRECSRTEQRLFSPLFRFSLINDKPCVRCSCQECKTFVFQYLGCSIYQLIQKVDSQWKCSQLVCIAVCLPGLLLDQPAVVVCIDFTRQLLNFPPVYFASRPNPHMDHFLLV